MPVEHRFPVLIMPTNIPNRTTVAGQYTHGTAQQGGFGAYHQLSSLVSSSYTRESGEMGSRPSDNDTGRFSVSGVIVATTGLLVAALVGIVWNNLSGDVSDLKKDQKEVTRSISDSKIEIVKSVTGVEKQIIQTNQKLDDFIAEMRKRR